MTIKKVWICCAICAVGFIFHASQLFAHSNSNEAGNPQAVSRFQHVAKSPNAEQTSAACAAIWWHSDPFFFVLLIIALGLS